MSDSNRISVTCPHCHATLTVDTEAAVVVGHQPPPSHKEKIDFDTRLKQMEEEKKRAAGRLEEAMRAEKSRDRLLEDRFKELMDDAKNQDDTTPPIRDIDLD
jgi:uncharacterized Zn finger protein (UPF0148 family)